MNAAKSSNGRVSWTTLVSTASLAIAITSGGYAIIQGQINTVKELTAADRQGIRRQLEDNDRITESLRDRKLDVERFNQALAVIAKQFDDIDSRLDKLEQRGR